MLNVHTLNDYCSIMYSIYILFVYSLYMNIGSLVLDFDVDLDLDFGFRFGQQRRIRRIRRVRVRLQGRRTYIC